MRIERIPTLADNYSYLVVDEETGEAAVIDPAEAGPIAARVEASGARVTKILATHHHPDHCGACPDLAQRYHAPVLGHVSDAGRMPGFTDGLEEDARIRIGKLEARVLFVPAHTRGHIAFLLPGAVFCGDTLFAGGCGRIFEGTAQMMYDALNVKLASLPGETLVYCGHEYTESNLRFALTVEPGSSALRKRMEQVRSRRSRPAPDWRRATEEEFTIPSTIAEERATNPFLRVEIPEVIASALRAQPGAATDPVTVLGRIRTLKDRF